MTELHSNPKTRPAGWVPREFRIFSDISVLIRQGKWWRGKDGRYIKVKDMHPKHRANAARMLERNAGNFAAKFGWAITTHYIDAPDDVMDYACREEDEALADPLRWIRQTAIYRALTTDVVHPDLRTDDIMIKQLAEELGRARIAERIEDVPAVWR